MNERILSHTLIDGIKSYSAGEAEDYSDYPEEGFDVTQKLEQKSFWVRSRNRILKKLVYRYSEGIARPKFFEVGCGTGTFITQLISDPNLQITGSEIYARGLVYAKKKMQAVDFVQYDVRQGVIAESAYDVIGSFDVLEHIDDDVTSMANIYAMLKDGGHFILTVPQYMFMWSRIDDIVKHKRRYSRQEMVSKLKSQGFEIEYVSSFLCLLFPLMMISRLLDKKSTSPEQNVHEDTDLESRVSFPSWLNELFNQIMKIDEFLISRKVNLPFGGSLLVVAKKPGKVA